MSKYPQFTLVHVSLDPPKSTFSTDYISARRGCWPLKFLHTLDNGQGLLAHTANRARGPRKNFKGETWLEAGVIKRTLILQGVPPTKFSRAKNLRNSARFLTTFDFDREYLRKLSTHRKSEKYLINYVSYPIRRKKNG